MTQNFAGPRLIVGFVLVAAFAIAACAPAAAPQQQAPAAPAAPPAKPAAEPAKPAAPPAKPAAEPAKPAAQPAKPAAEPAKPAAQAAKPAATPALELRAGSSGQKGTAESDTLDIFAEVVAEKSKGAVVIRVFYQSLGVEQQLAQAVSAGSVDIGMLSNGNSGRFTTAYYIYDLPFLFKTYENVLKSLETPVGKQAIAQFEKDLGVKLLFPVSWGRGRDVQSRNKQLRTPADIKGLKIRVISSPVDLATFKAWGANPTPVDWAQTFPALQQGVVDGENIPFHLLLPSKHYEVIKHSTQLDYQAVFQQVYVNAKTFASLSPEHQNVLREAARDTQPLQRRRELQKIESAAQELQKLGVQLYTPTPQEYAQWASIREKVWQEVAEEQKGKIDLNLAKQMYESQ